MKVFCTGDIGDEKAIISYLSDKLHLFYKNFSVRKIKKIPRNTSGKVLYEQLDQNIMKIVITKQNQKHKMHTRQ